ncbi:MAG TPA: DUF1559 domain-containing protein [Gemmataceae bacterium]|nr:DUF1559 domain-containing protein [Gemmataceae bacterium]
MVSFVNAVRHAAWRMSCANNLSTIGMACQFHHDCLGHFPTGTVPNHVLAPDKRFSWLPQIWPSYINGGTALLLDTKQAWDAQTNCPPRWQSRLDFNGTMGAEKIDAITVFLCPAVSFSRDRHLLNPTHYVGVAGLGERAAELPLTDAHAGFFGYDRQVSRQDIKDGLATTIAVVEALDGGPWTAGGQSTLRSLLPADRPYVGEGGQFASMHRDSSLFFPGSQPVITNVVFADGSVRRFTGSVSPQIIEQLVTIAGGEQVDELPP